MLGTWVRVYAESNGTPDWIAAELTTLFAATTYGSLEPLTLYLGWDEDRPAASAASFRAAGVVGPYEVATLPAFRRHGLATKIGYRALSDARQDGYARLWHHAITSDTLKR
jgi:GNAT superfamily N-acetyltransferase